MKISPYIKTVKSVITANSPVLLLGTTIAGVVTTGVLAAKAGWKAREIVFLEEMRRESEAREGLNNLNPEGFETFAEHREAMQEVYLPLTTQEIAQLTWMEFALPALSGAGTIAAAVGTHTIHTKRANAMAALYAVTSNKLDDMSEKAEELLGPKKTQQLNNEIAQRQVDRNPVDNSEVIILDENDELCYDEWSGRWFKSSMNKIEGAINAINRQLIDEGDASLNDFYERVGLPTITMGSSFGWSGEKIDGRFGAVTAHDGRPAISVSFYQTPKDDLGH